MHSGSFRCRAGWASETEPRLDFRNFLTRQRTRKEGEVQIGNNISNVESVRWLLRTQFDRDVVTHFDIQEQIFDHIFDHLGIESDGLVEHSVVITEALCNPNYSRHCEFGSLLSTPCESANTPQGVVLSDCILTAHYFPLSSNTFFYPVFHNFIIFSANVSVFLISFFTHYELPILLLFFVLIEVFSYRSN